MHVSPRVDLFCNLVHLIIDVAVSRSLEDLMPLFGFWVELVHVIRAAIRVCTRKKVEQTSMLNHSMADMTGQPFAKIEKDTDRDYFLSAAEAKEYGLIDRVIAHPGEA